MSISLGFREWGCPKSGDAHITVTPGLSRHGGPQDNKPVSKSELKIACVAGFRKGRGRELGRDTTREGGGRRGTPARKPLFSPTRLLIRKMTNITQL